MTNLNDGSIVQLQYIIDNIDKVPKDRFMGHVLPLVNKSEYGSYEWEAGFVGVTDKKELVYIFSSGCSCNDPTDDGFPSPDEEATQLPDDVDQCKDKTIKGLDMEIQSMYLFPTDFTKALEESIKTNYELITKK